MKFYNIQFIEFIGDTMKIIKTIMLIFLLVLIILFCIFSGQVANTFVNTAVVCVKNVIPSLFPVMFVSLLIINCNLIEILPQRQRFFGLFLLSSISGYPVGAKLLDLYCNKKCIKKETATLLLPAFINAGPGFIINTVGLGVLNNKSLGVILFASQFLASFVLFILLGGFSFSTHTKSSTVKITKAIQKSALDAVDSLKNICTYLVLISCFSKIIELVFGEKFSIYFVTVAEITSAVLRQKNVYAVCILLSFCGLCVYLQIFSFVKKFKIKFIELILWRTFHIVISLGILKFIIKAFKITLPVFSNTAQNLVPTQNSGIFFSLFLIFTLFCFMLSIKRKSSGNLLKDLI